MHPPPARPPAPGDRADRRAGAQPSRFAQKGSTLIRLVPWRQRSKRQHELRYWHEQQRAEGTLRNLHYEWLFTEAFGLSAADYADRRVLDIGCGPRGSLEWAVQAAERVGLDPLAADYRELGVDAHAMRYVSGAAEAIPFEDEHFDIVTTFNALDHVDDVDRAIAEMTRVTKLGGLALVLVEIEHAATPTEPHTLAPNFLSGRSGWRIERERRTAVSPDHNIHVSFMEGRAWTGGPGVLGVRLRRAG